MTSSPLPDGRREYVVEGEDGGRLEVRGREVLELRGSDATQLALLKAAALVKGDS